MNTKELVLKKMFGINNKYAGYENICNKLITDGVCISTIHASDIFRNGGIHNFIKQEPFEEGVDLIKFSLDKEKIYEWGMFKEYAFVMLNDKLNEFNELKSKLNKLDAEISELIEL